VWFVANAFALIFVKLTFEKCIKLTNRENEDNKYSMHTKDELNATQA